jgi:putative MATE family efflux protein
MQKHSGRVSPFIGDRAFYLEFFIIAMPIILQQTIATAMGFVDSVMVGQIEEQAMAGVMISNKYFLIFQTVLFGVTGGFGIFISQYFGAKEHEKGQGLFVITTISSVMISGLFLALISLAPRAILSLFLSDPVTIDYGLAYLHYVRFSYLPFAFSMACMTSLRAIGQTRVPMIIGSLCIVLNTGLNFLFIFGHFGFPALGVRGAGLGTLIARIVEMALYICLLAPGRRYFSLHIHPVRRLTLPIIQQAVKKTIPFTGNELLWSLGATVLFWTYCMVNETYIAGLAIVEATGNFVFVIIVGLASAISVQVGANLGADRLTEAKQNANRIIALGMAIALALGLVVFLLSNQIPQLFNVSTETRALACSMLRIQAIFYLVVTLNIAIFFIVRIGGDVQAALFIDSIFIWLVVIPVALLMSLVIKPPMIIFYLVIQFLELVKAPITLHYLKRGRWIKNLT